MAPKNKGGREIRKPKQPKPPKIPQTSGTLTTTGPVIKTGTTKKAG